MTAPTGPVSQTFEEIEAATKPAANAPKPEEIKVPEVEGVPDVFKGKTMADIIRIATDAQEAVKLSVQRQKELEAAASAAPPAPAAVVEEPKPEPELTKEQIAELYQKDPIAAIEYMSAQAERRVQQNVEKRLGTLVSGTATAAEQAARIKYPDEFALFGDQITATVKALPHKEPLSQPQAWDDLVAYIRGKGDNLDKLFEFRINKTKGKQAADAQAAQAAAAGPATQSTTRAPASPAAGAEGLDALELEVAGKMGLSPQEYAKWKRVA